MHTNQSVQGNCLDLDLSAGGWTIDSEESAHGAAERSAPDATSKNCPGFVEHRISKRLRSVSHEPAELLCAKNEAQRTNDDEGAGAGCGNDLKGSKAWVKKQSKSAEEREKYQKQNLFESSSGVGSTQQAATAVEGDCHTVATSRCVAVYVPTMFTTAAGRPICVREKRTIDAASPYWNLMSFNPDRDAALSAETISATVMESERGPALSVPKYKQDVSDRDVLQSPRQFLTSTHLCEDWISPRPLRATSCPERSHTSPEPTRIEDLEYSLPAFTGFCAANGQPFFTPMPYHNKFA